MPTHEPEVIDAAIREATRDGHLHYAFGGNCAKFAVALNRALGGEGECAYVDGGGHYEYVDHVALLYEGEYYDGSGRLSEEEFLDSACFDEDEDEDDEREPDTGTASDEDILRMVDDSGGGVTPPFDGERFERDFREVLARLEAGATPAPPSSR